MNLNGIIPQEASIALLAELIPADMILIERRSSMVH
jgi:hypothetical protein